MSEVTPQPDILVIDGHFQKIGDWYMAAALQASGISCLERTQSHDNGSDPDRVTPADITGKKTILCYSHGGLSVADNTNWFRPLICDRVIGVCIVASGTGGGAGDWWFPDTVGQVVVFQLTPDISDPTSEPVQQLDPTEPELWFDWGDTAGEAAIQARNPDGSYVNRRVNIKCNGLLPWWRQNILWAVKNHQDVCNIHDLIACVVRILGGKTGSAV